ncbi:MAG: GDSL-type esterase/lipase family protein [Candidatus Binatia bacterium]
MRTYLPRLLLLFAATTTAALAAEAALRSGLLGSAGIVPDVVTRKDIANAHWRQPGKDFVWHGQVGRAREFDVPSRWNALGYNDADYPLEKPPGTLRVVVIGDSYVEAVQVAQDRSFHNLLETRLARGSPARVEVIALGASGAGPRRSLETLRSLGLRYRPDIVVFEFLGFNDVSDDSAELSAAFHAQMRRLEQVSSRVYLPEVWRGESSWAHRLRLADSRLAALLGQGWNDAEFRWRVARLDPRDRFPHHWFAFKKNYDPADPYERAWSEGWDATLGLLRDAKEASAAAGARFLLVRFTDHWRVAPDGIRQLYSAFPALLSVEMDFERDARLLEALSREHAVAYLDLFPAFRAHWNDNAPLHFRSDTHWTAAGHAVAAAAIERRLREEGWIPDGETRDP